MGVDEKIKALEDEVRNTKRHKGTEHHIGLLLAKIARLKRERVSQAIKRSSVSGGGFDIRKEGDATVVMVGFPSVGKSTLITKITNAKSKVAAYEFTTLECIPGILEYGGASIQMLDLPGIIAGAQEGKGRGREILSVARKADLILILLESGSPQHYEVIARELSEVGIRLDGHPPRISVKKGIKGGIRMHSAVKLTRLSPQAIISILNEYGYHNGDITFGDDYTADDLIDVLEGNRVYSKSLVVVNKVDLTGGVPPGFPPGAVGISADRGAGMEELKKAIYEKLGFMKIYTKPRAGEVKWNEPMIMRKGATVEDMCRKLPKGFLKDFKYALIWGKSAKFQGQRVGPDHVLQDGDVVYVVKK
ncbi:MAG: GTP-binding protein [Candidatus ainarchaeum sp.]|nr:GTP-binding protein [Candidatus ainarchaeum sp.]